jgi:uncharacterized membrane-anchored protein YjiN (DUF445 family)
LAADETGETTAAAVEAPSAGRSQWLATGLLLLALASFLLTHLPDAPGFWIMLLRRMSEAALVGGIADWFAIVALFRHPLGLPIPHTAVIPSNKDRIGSGLGRFVEQHVLEPETVAQRLQAANLSARAAAWLGREENAAAVADRCAQALAFLVAALPEDELRRFVHRAGIRQLASIELAPLAAAALQTLRDSGRHQELYDKIIITAREYLDQHRHTVTAMVRRRTRGVLPALLDQGLAEALVQAGLLVLDELALPDSPTRRDFDRSVARLIGKVRDTPDYRAEMESFKRDILASPQLEAAFDRAAQDIRRLLLEDIASQRSSLRGAITSGLTAFAARIGSDDRARRRLERKVIWVARSLVLPWRENIGRFIADTIRSWEAGTVADRLEAAVGRDLQYIRINGTLVGGLVGGAIFLISEFLL